MQVTTDKWITVRCFKQYAKCYHVMEIFCKLFLHLFLKLQAESIWSFMWVVFVSDSHSFSKAFFQFNLETDSKRHSMNTTVNSCLLIFMLLYCIDSCWWLLLINVHVTLLLNTIAWYSKMFKCCNNWHTRLNL